MAEPLAVEGVLSSWDVEGGYEPSNLAIDGRPLSNVVEREFISEPREKYGNPIFGRFRITFEKLTDAEPDTPSP
jgi:hypothetical protein